MPDRASAPPTHHLLLATTNPHKVREVREILAPLGVGVLGLDQLPPSADDLAGSPASPLGEGQRRRARAEPVEDAHTFLGNARLKAVGYARATGRLCLAEDSGLEVDALGGAPGVHSARYAGVSGSREERDRANNQRLLAELGGVPLDQRTARFVCALCLAGPDGRLLAETVGSFEGLVTEAPRGTSGFGYDPLLLVPELGRTSAELTAAEKNARSHRGAATRAMAARLAELDLDAPRRPPATLPPDLEPLTTRGDQGLATTEWDAPSVPVAWVTRHSLPAGVWVRLRVHEGSLVYVLETTDGRSEAHWLLTPEQDGAIAPEQPFRLQVDPSARFTVEYWGRPGGD